ncbi:MAG: hypothetical protein OQK35_02070, partial [Alphaproteobacteria bacterium]|nr:hypothetical protein [Alphaproteobacteria bacterium]
LEHCLEVDSGHKDVQCSLLYIDFGSVLRSPAFTRLLRQFKKDGGKTIKVYAGDLIDEYATVSDQQDSRSAKRHAPIPDIVDDEKRRLELGIDKRRWQNFLHLKRDNIDIKLRLCLEGLSPNLFKKMDRSQIKKHSLASTAKILRSEKMRTVRGSRWSKENVRTAWDTVRSEEYQKFAGYNWSEADNNEEIEE